MSSFIYDQINQPFGLDILTPDNPATATDLSLILDYEYLFRPISIRFKMETDANAANRLVKLVASIGGLIVATAPPIREQTASLIFQYAWSYKGRSTDLLGLNLNSNSVLGEDWNLPGPVRIFSQVDNIQVGDKITDVVLHVKRWERLT